MRRSTVLSFPLQLVFPALIIEVGKSVVTAVVTAVATACDTTICIKGLCYMNYYGDNLLMFVLSLWRAFQPSPMFASKPGAYQSGAHLMRSPLG
jgi:hypothetical protein